LAFTAQNLCPQLEASPSSGNWHEGEMPAECFLSFSEQKGEVADPFFKQRLKSIHLRRAGQPPSSGPEGLQLYCPALPEPGLHFPHNCYWVRKACERLNPSFGAAPLCHSPGCRGSIQK